MKEFGHRLTPYGDGPDGGRDATFEGRVQASPDKQPWDGYLVIQVKHRQKPVGSDKDSLWLATELKKELRLFEAATSNRRKPDFYIIATNVALSPVPESKPKRYRTGKGSKASGGSIGGIARIENVFQEHGKNINLKDHGVWHYDKLRTLLDIHIDIARKYSAWITPGDVLSDVIERLPNRSNTFGRVMSLYLQRELRADQYAKLEQAGHSPEEQTSLASVFVDTPVSVTPTADERSTDNVVAMLLAMANAPLDPETQERFSKSVEIEDKSTRMPGRFVLIGGPGQGKTTVGQFMAQLYRTSLLKEQPRHLLSPETKPIIENIESQCKAESISPPRARRFPIRISLPQFADALARSTEKVRKLSLLSYIVEHVSSQTNHDISLNDFRAWLSQYPWALILDGLDEVPASSNRSDVITEITNFWDEANSSNADIFMLITTRPQGYNEDLSPGLYHHRWLMPLSPGQALHYAHRLIPVRYRNDPSRQNRILERLQTATEEPAVARLMTSPLQVTIMAALVDKIGEPPQDRWQLFNDYYGVIYDREREKRVPTAAVLNSHRADVDAIHQDVGLVLQTESESRGSAEALLTRARLNLLIRARLDEQGHANAELDDLCGKIITAAMQRLVFLVGRKDEEVGFEIRSLQEFMAAEALMRGGETAVQVRLRHVARFSHWRNVFLFAAGKCFVSAPHQHLRDTILTICEQLNRGIDDDIDKATLSGSRLALDLLEDGIARNQPRYRRHLLEIAFGVLDTPLSDLNDKLVSYYEERFDDLYREALLVRIRNDQGERSLSAWHLLVTLIERGVSWAGELADAHWPAERDFQYKIFSTFRRIELSTRWSRNKVADVVLHSKPSKADLLVNMLPIEARRHSLLFHVASDLKNGWSGRIPLKIDGLEDCFRFALTPIDSTLFEGVAYVDDCSPGWSVIQAGARFASNPTHPSLARELRKIAFQLNLAEVRPYSSDLPWPLGSCLTYADSSEELFVIADRIERGELGTYFDWKAAERRLNKNGVLLEDLRLWESDEGPFNAEIATRGVPFEMGYSIAPAAQAIPTAIALLDLAGEMRPSRGQSVLAGAAVFILSVVSSKRVGAKPSITAERQAILEAILKSSRFKPYVSTRMLTAFDNVNWADPSWLNIVDLIGLELSPGVDETADSSLLPLLMKIFQMEPQRRGLRRLLALHSEVDELALEPQLLNVAPVDTDHERAAVAMLRIASRDWKDSELGQLVDMLLTDSGVLWRLLHALGTSKPNTINRRLLLLLATRASAWTEWVRIFSLLYGRVNDAQSGISQENLWVKEFRLSKELLNVLGQESLYG
jgi:hypothetical protein